MELFNQGKDKQGYAAVLVECKRYVGSCGQTAAVLYSRGKEKEALGLWQEACKRGDKISCDTAEKYKPKTK
jgi:hypothetical protein